MRELLNGTERQKDAFASSRRTLLRRQDPSITWTVHPDGFSFAEDGDEKHRRGLRILPEAKQFASSPTQKEKEPTCRLFLFLLRAARELRTVIQGGWHSYAMDAAVKVLRNEEPFDEETMRWMEKVHK